MRYFNNVINLENLRKQYKELLKQFHPDNPQGSKETTQAINAEYENLFRFLKDRHKHKESDSERSKNSKSYEDMKYDFSEDEKLREILQNIINYSGINIEIIGCWIWVDGNTLEYKDNLKALGFKWAREKKKWYFHTEAFRKKSHRKLDINDIRNYYGSTEVQTDEQRQIKQA